MNNPLTSKAKATAPIAGPGKRPHRSDSPFARASFWPLVLLFTAVDTTLILGAMTVVLGQGTAMALFASASVAVLAAYTAHEAGKQTREARIWGRTPAAASVLLLLFIAIVVGLTYIRWNAGALTDTTISFEGTTSTDEQNAFTHHMTALALAPMLCATGIIAFLHGLNAKTSIEREHQKAATELDAARARLVELEADVVRDTLAVRAHEYEIRQVAAQEQRHLKAAKALAAEAKAYAHRKVYLALGTPNASGMTDIDPDVA